MARQTRRRRDSKVKSRFKNRPTPSISRASSADIEKVGTAMKSSKVDWRTVGLLILIFIFSLVIRIKNHLVELVSNHICMKQVKSNQLILMILRIGN